MSNMLSRSERWDIIKPWLYKGNHEELDALVTILLELQGQSGVAIGFCDDDVIEGE